MPVVQVLKTSILALLEEPGMTDQQFDQLCCDFGMELDEITSQKEIMAKDRGAEAAEGLSDEVLYKIDVAANRYDLLCMEGLVRSLRIFQGKEQFPVFRVVTPPQDQIVKIRQTKATGTVREFCVGAVLRGMTFTQESYDSFIDLQDKLHQNIGRHRTLASIGTHDMSSIQPGEITYDALPFDQIRFVPLSEEKEFDMTQLHHHYKTKEGGSHLKPYVAITEGFDVHPVMLDSKNVVLSAPPLINGEHSKIKLSTTDVLIEATGTDWTKLNIVLNIVVAMFSQYTSNPFTIEQVEVNDEAHGRVVRTPDLSETKFETSVEYIRSLTSAPLDGPTIVQLLAKMSLKASVDPNDANKLQVLVPATRPDILHECDIAEDVAIAYGYNALVKTVPNTFTIGREQPLNQLSDLIRGVLAEVGYNEVLTWVLTSHESNFEKMNQVDTGDRAVKVKNYKQLDMAETRLSLVSGLMQVVYNSNKTNKLPLRVFEVGDTVQLDAKNEVGASNTRRAAAVYCGANESGFEEMQGLLDRLMNMNNTYFISYKSEEAQALDAGARPVRYRNGALTRAYYVRPSENPSYFPGRRADVFVDGTLVGVFGILHPNVIKGFKLGFTPCSALEIDIQYFE
jgi:phenylalanyl-tRNA synthetase beta chain